MGEIGHVVLRGRTFHFRRVVPAHLRLLIGRREFLRSLGTSDPRTARLRAAQLYLASERILTAPVADPMFTPDDLARLVQDFYATILEQENRHRLTGRPMTAEMCERRGAYYDRLARDTRESLRCNRLDDARLVTLSLLSKRKIPLDDLQPADFAQAKQAMLRAGINVAEALKARYAGDFNYEPTDKLLTAKLAELQPVQAPAETTPAPEPAFTGPLMSEVGETFRLKQAARKAWDAQTAFQARSTYRLFVDVCGDKPLPAYTRKDAALFRDRIERLPNDYGKSPVFKNLSVQAIIDTYAALPPARQKTVISQRTVQRHFSALSALWATTLPEGEVAQNIFEGFRFTGAKLAVDQREMWSRDDLKRLFATPVWTGCKSLERRSTAGSLILRDEAFWLPLIAVFSGLRQEEICQLHVEDIQCEDGIWFFDINKRSPRMLKNQAAVRRVPIHPELVRLGLLLRVEEQRRAQNARLFPDLKPGGADNRLGHAFTKRFTYYRGQVKLRRPGLDFHSFRHTATTLLHQAGVADSVKDHLTGHTTAGETARYTKGSTLKQLAEGIARIDIGVDLTDLHVAGPTAP
ncbi:site-specific integrase [Methylobacterium sp. WL12]|uniref:site-specific integrase n=1 Tax=Methylobacterium sp. WL12 TaxID=2603890 RepID=UPI0011CC0B86|nr:site-specific integrase [Methylobacterium sp. WL12]TXM64826.1 site-specific integrase [Methylobacterium sp. WL12]